MASSASTPLDALRRNAQALSERAHVPFSGEAATAVGLLQDGRWIPGVRVESASFSLTLPAATNVLSTAVALDLADALVALVLQPVTAGDRAYIAQVHNGPFHAVAKDAFVRADIQRANGQLPMPTTPADPFVPVSEASPPALLRETRRIAQRAYVPASEFPVGALLETDAQRFIPGVNVEHPDWTRILCAERNALGTAHSYSLTTLKALYLSCPLDARGTPCGACRQWLVELAPSTPIWMDRGDQPADQTTPQALLPGSFSGQAIPRSTL